MSRHVPPSLGSPVTVQTFNISELARREWGAEFSAPDHRVYEFSGGRAFDSSDRGTSGIYRRPTS